MLLWGSSSSVTLNVNVEIASLSGPVQAVGYGCCQLCVWKLAESPSKLEGILNVFFAPLMAVWLVTSI